MNKATRAAIEKIVNALEAIGDEVESLRDDEQEKLDSPLPDLNEAGFFTGHAPNYVKVYAEAGDLHNQLRRVRVAGLCRDGVLGELVDEAEKTF